MKSTIRGMFLLGKGNHEGLQDFSDTTDGVLSAMAPWLALAFVGNILPLLFLEYKNTQSIYIGISSFLVKIVCLLVHVVIIHSFAVLWKKEGNWQKTVTAMLWCRWVPIIDLILFVVIFGTLFVSSPYIFLFLICFVTVLYLAYSLWLNWFVVKAGLEITVSQSVVVVLTMIIAMIVCYSVFFACNYDYMMQLMHDVQQQMQNNIQMSKS